MLASLADGDDDSYVVKRGERGMFHIGDFKPWHVAQGTRQQGPRGWFGPYYTNFLRNPPSNTCLDFPPPIHMAKYQIALFERNTNIDNPRFAVSQDRW